MKPLKVEAVFIAVGNRVVPVPPHRSERAQFRHSAPILSG
jgi:hypothetical protein